MKQGAIEAVRPRGNPYQKRVVNSYLSPMEKLTKEMHGFLSPRKGLPLLLIPEYSGIKKEQRNHGGSKTAHRKPPDKCFLTNIHFNLWPIISWVVCIFDTELQELFICFGAAFLVGMSNGLYFSYPDRFPCLLFMDFIAMQILWRLVRSSFWFVIYFSWF